MLSISVKHNLYKVFKNHHFPYNDRHAGTSQGSSGNFSPKLCGVNTGSHIYIDAGTGLSSQASLTALLTQAATWQIKVRRRISCEYQIENITPFSWSIKHISARLSRSRAGPGPCPLGAVCSNTLGCRDKCAPSTSSPPLTNICPTSTTK